MTDVVSSPLQVDRQRRTTLPSNVLAAAGIPAGSALMARVEEPGRIVLESPQLLLAQLQQRIAAGRATLAVSDVGDDINSQGGADDTSESTAPQLSMAEELLAERAAEALVEVAEDADDAANVEPAASGAAAGDVPPTGRGSHA